MSVDKLTQFDFTKATWYDMILVLGIVLVFTSFLSPMIYLFERSQIFWVGIGLFLIGFGHKKSLIDHLYTPEGLVSSENKSTNHKIRDPESLASNAGRLFGTLAISLAFILEFTSDIGLTILLLFILFCIFIFTVAQD